MLSQIKSIIVEFSKCGTNKVSEIIKILHDSKPEVFGILKRRYNEVKSASKEIIKKFGSNEMKRRKNCQI